MILVGDAGWLIPVSLHCVPPTHTYVSQGTLAVAGLHTRSRVTPSPFESQGYSKNNALVCQSTVFVYPSLPTSTSHRLIQVLLAFSVFHYLASLFFSASRKSSYSIFEYHPSHLTPVVTCPQGFLSHSCSCRSNWCDLVQSLSAIFRQHRPIVGQSGRSQSCRIPCQKHTPSRDKMPWKVTSGNCTMPLQSAKKETVVLSLVLRPSRLAPSNTNQYDSILFMSIWLSLQPTVNLTQLSPTTGLLIERGDKVTLSTRRNISTNHSGC